MGFDKKKETTNWGIGVVFLLLIFFFTVASAIKPNWFNPMLPNQMIIAESESVSTVNLRIVQKVTPPRMGFLNLSDTHYLVLSNGMIAYISAREFDEYEVDEFYNFTLVEKITTSRRIKTK